MSWTRDKLQRLPRPMVVAVCVFGILINFATLSPQAVYSIFQDHSDFRSFYIGAKLVASGDIYNVDHVLESQRQLFGGTSRTLLPVRLPFFYAFLSPLANVPIRVGQWIWLAGMILATGIFIWLYSGPGRARTAVVCCWSWPLLLSLPMGQDLALVLLFLGAALWAIYARKNWWMAGLLFSLCLIKFNLFLLFPLLIVGKRKWRLAAGAFAGAACLTAISFVVAGWEWPRQYAAVIFDPRGSPNLAGMPNLHGLMFNLHGFGVPEYLISLAVIGMVWWVIRHRPFGIAAAATLLGSLLLSQHSYLQDCAILIPALLILVRPACGRLVRFGALVLLLPLPYELSLFRGRGSALAVLLLVLLIAIVLDKKNRVATVPAIEP